MSAPSVQTLKRALSIAEQIQKLEAELAGILGQVPKAPKSLTAQVAASAPAAVPRKKGKMSAAGRAAIVAAQKKRWAKVKAEKSGKKG